MNLLITINKAMKLTTRKERINFDVASDLTARHRICAAFLGYNERKQLKLITNVKSSTTMKTRKDHVVRILSVLCVQSKIYKYLCILVKFILSSIVKVSFK